MHVEGLIGGSLIGAVPSAASWRLSGLPRFLEPEQARALLDSCDPQTATGRRDLAILTLLLRLGLRAGEVAGLRLEDLDWRAGELVVVGKGRRSERLPLPVDVGEAITGYLRDGRPDSALGRTVFIRVKAPHQRLTTVGSPKWSLRPDGVLGWARSMHIACGYRRYVDAQGGVLLREIGRFFVTVAALDRDLRQG